MHLFLYTHRHTIVIKVDVPRDEPEMPSCGIDMEGGELAGA